jgi:hypothetical protein
MICGAVKHIASTLLCAVMKSRVGRSTWSLNSALLDILYIFQCEAVSPAVLPLVPVHLPIDPTIFNPVANWFLLGVVGVSQDGLLWEAVEGVSKLQTEKNSSEWDVPAFK